MINKVDKMTEDWLEKAARRANEKVELRLQSIKPVPKPVPILLQPQIRQSSDNFSLR